MRDARAAGFVGCARAQVDNSTTPPDEHFLQRAHRHEHALEFRPVRSASRPPARARGRRRWMLRFPPVRLPRRERRSRPSCGPARCAELFRTRRPANPLDADLVVDDTRGLANAWATPIPIVVTDCQFRDSHHGYGLHALCRHRHDSARRDRRGHQRLRQSGTCLPAGAIVQPVQTVVYYIASCAGPGANCTAATPPHSGRSSARVRLRS